MTQGQGIGDVDISVAGIAQRCVVVVAKDAGRAVVAQRAQSETRHIAHDVGAAIAQRGLRLGHPDLGFYTLAPLALHRLAAGAWVVGELGIRGAATSWEACSRKSRQEGGLGGATTRISDEKALADPESSWAAGSRGGVPSFHRDLQHFVAHNAGVRTVGQLGSQSARSAAAQSASS